MTRENRDKITGLSKRGPGRPRSTSAGAGKKGKMKQAMEEAENGEEQTEDIEMDQEAEEQQDTTDEEPNPKGKDIRETTGEGEEGKKDKQKETRGSSTTRIGKKPRQYCEVEIPGEEESGPFANKIEELIITIDGYLGIRIAKERGKKKVVATFRDTMGIHDACNTNFGNEETPVYMTPTENKSADEDLKRQVIIRDIPLTTGEGATRNLLRKFGEIENLRMRTVEMWQTAIVTFQNEQDAEILGEQWAIPFGKEYLRILPAMGEKEALAERSKYVLKLTGLQSGTTAYDLEEIARELDAKTIYIPRTGRYYRERFAFMAFQSEESMNNALNKCFEIGRTQAKMVEQHAQLCYKCGQDNHFAYECGEVKIQQDKRAAQARFAAMQSRFGKGPEGQAPITFADVMRKRSRSRQGTKKDHEDNNRQRELTARVSNLEARIQAIEAKMDLIMNRLINREKQQDKETDQEETYSQEVQEEEEMEYEQEQQQFNLEQDFTEAVQKRQDRMEQQMDKINEALDLLLGQGMQALEEKNNGKIMGQSKIIQQ